MSGHQIRSSVLTLGRSSSSSSHASDASDSPRGALKPETQRSPLLGPSAKFDTQVAVLPIRFQAMTRITVSAAMESRPRLELKRRTDSTGNGSTGGTGESISGSGSGDLQSSARKARTKPDQRRSKARGESGELMLSEQPVGLLVALFHDGFVCRHINKDNEGVEGFAQPYDAESSYFLACIDNGRVPEGLPDMIACAHYNGSVLAEIRDYRELRTALCPVSSAFLPAASALLLADSELEAGCRVWQTLLLPGKSPLPSHAQESPLFEPPSIFDHFPDVTPSELETLAMDAKRQLLHEEDVLLSSSSTESSSPRDAEPHQTGHTDGDQDVSGSTTTPTTRLRLHCGLEASPPASVLSPIERKSARSSLNSQEDNSTKRCKRQIQTKVKGSCQRDKDRNPDQEDINLKAESAATSARPDSSANHDHDMEMCESPGYYRSESRSYSELLGEDNAQITPLPATQLFLSKLKGKRRRPDNELLYGKPAWVTIAHVGRFFRAATRLEREHSRFLHANARKLMQAQKTSLAETEHVSGSMRYLARQLGDLTRPSDVIAVACARELKAAEDEGQELHEPDWMGPEDRNRSPASQSADASAALVSPDNERSLCLQRIDKDEDSLLGHSCELSTDTASLITDYQPTAAAPHFNAFDDDGNLQLQSA
ncbi:hypothetical protein PHYPSEUDO_001381 [Phytophthora pseudosyringae]|uniref:Uncharacterized protein n=1 Tax=Phytophthora pseudosyringae TaxID=221518 RepID=A0A8T1WEW1_9STRA|nr:hypothetical protein PHYPSEUDO_001381 [Phytophthora pseudosyringae]